MRKLFAAAIAIGATSCIVSTTPSNSCVDGIWNGAETDVDCGGPSCTRCTVGRHCSIAADCATSMCINGTCSGNNNGTCTDGIRNGGESDVDCGGGVCGACSTGKACGVPADCLSGVCAGTCKAPSCSDGVRNGDETGVDCGGSCPFGCHQNGAGTPMPNPNTVTVYRIQPGASSQVMPGATAGYAITANFGGSYRIVWTGDAGVSGTYHEFYGTVWTPGTFSNLVPGCNGSSCPLENDDYLSQITPVQGGQAINWDAFATTGIDGFDFVASAEPVMFDFFIDGQHYTNLVYFFNTDTQQITTTGTFPFGLTTN